MIGEGSFNVC